MTAHSAPKKLLERLEEAGIEYELLRHHRTATAVAEAEALGISPAQVAKTLVLESPTGYVFAVLPASERLDMHKLRGALDTDDVELASEEALAGAYPEFELGSVPPIGGHGERMVVDVHVREYEYAVVEAGTHEESLRIKTADLIALDDAFVAEICRD